MYGEVKDHLETLIGATINRLLVSSTREYLVFDTDKGAIGFRAEGD